MDLNQYWTDIYYYLHYTHGEEKVTHQMIRIMQHIDKKERVGVRDIAHLLQISQNTASEHMKRLIQKGYVEKGRDPKDERKVVLSLTPNGKNILFHHTSLDEKKLEAVYTHLSKEEQAMIEAAFRRLSEEAKRCFSS
ncbi:MarR family winged helix-turn-helix transcriptional regulator [Halalkalibacterium halodurans]|jgi:DNA-binding MarR family transcriptional regulator|uniref:HTH-type transcriptional regulator SarZ n=1 Tax=Halalkalibacterium halodurans (strain ATCC BAA-125 / DSM 18197 / FERM 7344 / JCM 9153 / C-125) TaxID=272558 RepID=Q9KF41_HALH5|nr:MarR family winged helix-turn-helix transcriptional regulator [Halalkalibacterium halodurans]MDY7221139.1 MarR family winged helix-turn-helix transcriptional regulator [Halalkalibacterium halodurans]MDY7240378.1 MarR family winged helix-turn-helix transcriptional regulator [Halalkalibacterium halodurans]MED3647567.1 MarR family winged helix-turn-helix transcriptional regulator [Halalkalibacterium halodurans]MED4082726.1 MarR family winged helix-turn-helix transcriptional regulator [Halalkali